MAKIKAVGFDYAGVMGGMKEGFSSYTAHVCRLLEIDIATYRKVYFSINHLINTGKISSWKEFAPLLLKKLDRLAKLPEYLTLVEQTARDITVIDTEMVDLVDELRSQGFKAGLLSNNTREIGENLRSQGLDTHFDIFMISAEEGLQKPDPALFLKFAGRLQVEPSELIFVDDAEQSLTSASECGFTPVLFRSIGQLRSELDSLGIPLDR